MKRIKPILTAISIGVLIVFILFVYNQTAQFVTSLSERNPLAGQVALVVLCILYLFFLLVPVVSIFRYRKTPELPDSTEDSDYPAYLQAVRANLKNHKAIQAEGTFFPAETDKSVAEQIDEAYAWLNIQGNAIIKKEATSVFLTTAVSQNGSLDAIFMIATLTKMIWRLITHYESRPSWGRIVQLYANVAGTVVLARTIEDMDLIEEQIEPLLVSVLGGSVMTLVPGAQTITNLLVSSITEGAINTLLTLRVGAITRSYLTATTQPLRGRVRRQASLEAAKLLGSIMKDNTVAIVKAFGRATKNATKATLGI